MSNLASERLGVNTLVIIYYYVFSIKAAGTKVVMTTCVGKGVVSLLPSRWSVQWGAQPNLELKPPSQYPFVA